MKFFHIVSNKNKLLVLFSDWFQHDLAMIDRHGHRKLATLFVSHCGRVIIVHTAFILFISILIIIACFGSFRIHYVVNC